MTFLQSTIHAAENRPAYTRFSVAEVLTKWRLHRRRRQHLRRLLRVAPHMIGDIGLTLETARLESEKPFWCD